MMPILKIIGKYIENKKLINYGATAYNFFIKSSKELGNLNVSDYKVYTTNGTFHKNNLMDKLKKGFHLESLHLSLKISFGKNKKILII